MRASYGIDVTVNCRRVEGFTRSRVHWRSLSRCYKIKRLAKTFAIFQTMKLSFFHFLHEQLATVPSVEHEDLSGKTVVVIGANIGLGFEAAKHFAKMNPDRIILGCRSKERGEAAATGETNPLLSYHSVISFFKIKN